MGGTAYPVWSETLLPLQKVPAPNSGQRGGLRELPLEPRKQPSSSATVLVAEDNEVLRQGLQLLLEADGYRVLPAAHGMDAIRQMQGTCPDLILSDISMPEMDGYAFFETVRSKPEWVTIPFIFLTAHAGREDVFQGRKLGAEDYLIKPVGRQELLTTVHSRLKRSQELRLAQLQQAYQTSLIMLSNAIELRDQYTRGHVERVMEYALAMARRLGWNYSQLEALRFGSILHDIGKIYLDDNLFRKPPSLEEKDWDVIKRHPVVGAEIVAGISFLSLAIPIIRHHHERWDGLGYPDGLAGNAIPAAARIVAVADALDAMTVSRQYRQACTPDEAYREIVACSGTCYDPAVVAAFQEVWPEIKQRIP
jgi:putative two-component system response regulator